MSDYRCGICKQVYIENLVGQDFYCQHSGMVHSQNSQFIAEDKVRDLERQLSEARKENEKCREEYAHLMKFSIDAAGNSFFHKWKDMESQLTAYQSAFGKVREALENIYNDLTPSILCDANGKPCESCIKDALKTSGEALTLLSTLNAQDAPQSGQGEI